MMSQAKAVPEGALSLLKKKHNLKPKSAAPKRELQVDGENHIATSTTPTSSVTGSTVITGQHWDVGVTLQSSGCCPTERISTHVTSVSLWGQDRQALDSEPARAVDCGSVEQDRPDPSANMTENSSGCMGVWSEVSEVEQVVGNAGLTSGAAPEKLSGPQGDPGSEGRRTQAPTATIESREVGEQERALIKLLMTKQKKVVEWRCQTCLKECIPVREESRCICGHRLKEHPAFQDATRPSKVKFTSPFACSRCPCKKFFFVVAEGAWILRCRCKHKHIEHNPTEPYVCNKKNCDCAAFDSPWVCNCNHPWSEHQQSVVSREGHAIALASTLSDIGSVQRTDLIAEPLILR